MKNLLFCGLIAIFILRCSTSETEKLNGTWIPVKQEIGGTVLPEAVFGNQKLVLDHESYTMSAESIDQGKVFISGNQIEIQGIEGPNAGKTFKAIYKFEGEHLIICYNLMGDVYPESFSTAGQPMYFMAEFRREE